MKTLWSAATRLAEQTPAKRNRCVDFLRVVSTLVVVTGHWLMAAPWVDAAGAHISHLLDVSPKAVVTPERQHPVLDSPLAGNTGCRFRQQPIR